MAATKLPVALQMYTLRDDAARDFAGTLKYVAGLGYMGVELAGFHGSDAPAVRQMLDDNGLVAVGTHTSLEQFEKGIGAVIDDHLALGCRYVAVPFLAESRRTSLDDYKKLGATMNELGAKLKESGLTLAYHNHAFEFETFGGDKYALDVLFDSCDADLVKVELDTFWVKKAGVDPAAYLRQRAGRVPLIHIKDMAKEADMMFAPVGEGTMDFDAIFEAASVAGGEYYIVEQDKSEQQPPMEAVKISINNLKQMGMVG